MFHVSDILTINVTRIVIYKDLKLNSADGQGIISPDMAVQWAEDMHLSYVPCSFVVRTAFVKGNLVTFDFKEYDFIMVDTAGHSHQNEVQKETMKNFVHSVDGLAEKEVFLVLSATTKYRDLLSIVDAYSMMTDYKLIFTKLDETSSYGNLLNIKLYADADLSYVTNGQNVPDAIEVFDTQKIVKQLLGGK